MFLFHHSNIDIPKQVGFSMRPSSAIVLQASLKGGESSRLGSGAYSVLYSSSTAAITVTMLTSFMLNYLEVISY